MSNDPQPAPTVTTAGPLPPRRRAALAFAAVGIVAVIAAGCGTSASKTSASTISAAKATTPAAVCAALAGFAVGRIGH